MLKKGREGECEKELNQEREKAHVRKMEHEGARKGRCVRTIKYAEKEQVHVRE